MKDKDKFKSSPTIQPVTCYSLYIDTVVTLNLHIPNLIIYLTNLFSILAGDL